MALRALPVSTTHKISGLSGQENVPLQKCWALFLSPLENLGHLVTGLCSPVLREIWYCHPVVLVSQSHFCGRNRCLKPCSDYISPHKAQELNSSQQSPRCKTGSWQIRSWVVILSLPQNKFPSWQQGLTANVQSWLVQGLGAEDRQPCGGCSAFHSCTQSGLGSIRGSGEQPCSRTAASGDISGGLTLERLHKCHPGSCWWWLHWRE